MISIKKLMRSHRARQQRLEVRRMFKEGTSFLPNLLLDLEESYIDIPNFLSKYSGRDARILELCESFDDIGDFKKRLEDAIYKTEKLDWPLGEVLDIELLVKHEEEHADAASDFGVKTKYVFYQDDKSYCHVATLNLDEVGKNWTKHQLKDFFDRFVFEVEKRKNPNIWKGAPVDHYGHPIYFLHS